MNDDFVSQIESLIERLRPIRLAALQAEEHFQADLDHVYLGNLQSARNLTHYVGLRRHDIRRLQKDLGRLALSSLGRLESHVVATLDALFAVLHKLAGREWSGRPIEETFAESDTGLALLETHATESLGQAPADRNVRIMVTMPSEAGDDPALIRDYLNRGMNVMRIICAHDGPRQWLRMTEHLRTAQQETNKRCKIVFDLAGPKLRTGPICSGPGIIRWKPERNELGQVVAVANVVFYTHGYFPDGDAIAIPVGGLICKHAQKGDLVELTDTRGRERNLQVIDVDESSCLCTNDRTGYVIPGTTLRLIREKDVLCEDVVGPLPESEHSISLSVGDDLVLTPFEIVGKAAVHNEDDVIYRPAQIGCSLATVFSDAEPGERIFFDDGRIGGVIRELHQEEGQPWLEVKITQAAKGTAKLRSEKGINLPDTELGISALTEGPGRSGICCQVRRLGLSLFCAVAGRRCGTN